MPGANIFLIALNYFSEEFNKKGQEIGGIISKEESIAALRHVNTYMKQYFGKTDITLGDLQKLVRGDVEKPSWGLPDVITAMYSKPHKDGKLKVMAGESYIELVKFPKNGLPEIESVTNFGASGHADSPHYTDQMDMFLNKQTKKMTLDKAEVLRTAEKVYSPR